MRIFLFVLSVLSLLIAAHKFSFAEHTGQHKGGLFFLLIGIQLLITAVLISEHRESRTPKSPLQSEKEDSKETGHSEGNASDKQAKGS